MRYLAFLLPLAIIVPLAGCAHGHVDVGFHERPVYRNYGYHDRQGPPVVVVHPDGRRDYNWDRDHYRPYANER